MRNCLLLLLALFAAHAYAYPVLQTAPPGFTNVSAVNITDTSGTPLQSGTATFQIVDTSGNPLSVKLGTGGQVTVSKATTQVTNGAFSVSVADVSLTLPSFPCVSLTITDNATGSVVWSNGCLQPTGTFYSLDQFSTNTSAIYPQAGSTVLGNLNVNGNLGITGNLTVGGFSPTNLVTKNADGVLNATQFSGTDIGAQVNAAFSSAGAPVTVKIPAGTYSFTNTITIPGNQYHLDCDAGATLTYTSNGDAIVLSGSAQGVEGIDGHGGCKLYGTAKAGNGIRIPASNQSYVTGMHIENFNNGVFVAGGNTVEIFNNTFRNDTRGIATTTITSYAPNAVHVHDNEFANDGWGYYSYNGGVVASRALGNVIRDNVFEANTTGDVYLAWDAHTVITGNYFESSGVAVSAGRGADNVFDIHIYGNYFTAAGYRSEVELGYGWDFFISENYEEGSAGATSGCAINLIPGGGSIVNVIPTNAFAKHSETSMTTNEVCSSGTPITNAGGTWRVAANLSSTGTIAATGQVSGLTGSFGGGATSAAPLLYVGAASIYNYTAAPSGVCTGAALAFGNWGLASCKNGAWVNY